ncbi:hypothetical protein [Paracoccus saliphilus]|uniref:Uncharacterized protein n=1 Tax=Paracoccus saliphilus TaxID=405559 RepID=A0AA45W2Q3_9RHOB|nr:hypothetical protein [Paracoccus saliphilus]WCR01398.1 hypothetical protein JHX88_10575 [Paracoccus saliphilus]SIS70006.1 hypothetical protein SAMN05421772_10385 [Paracoccus saliphilus]
MKSVERLLRKTIDAGQQAGVIDEGNTRRVAVVEKAFTQFIPCLAMGEPQQSKPVDYAHTLVSSSIYGTIIPVGLFNRSADKNDNQ